LESTRNHARTPQIQETLTSRSKWPSPECIGHLADDSSLGVRQAAPRPVLLPVILGNPVLQAQT
jgi:hypothetical protein